MRLKTSKERSPEFKAEFKSHVQLFTVYKVLIYLLHNSKMFFSQSFWDKLTKTSWNYFVLKIKNNYDFLALLWLGL